jgi:cell envelope opacity-associated protein A
MLIKDKPSPQEKVKALKAQLAPKDYASKMLACETYRNAQIVGRSQVDTWIQV